MYFLLFYQLMQVRVNDIIINDIIRLILTKYGILPG